MAVSDPDNCVEFFDKAQEPERCRCKDIVLTAYDNLRGHGLSEREAIIAGMHILRYHHPSPSREAKTVVECWVFEHSQHSGH